MNHMDISSPTDSPVHLAKAKIVPLSLALLVIGFFITFGLFVPWANGEAFNLIQLIFWLLPVPFLILPILKPKWTLPSLIALIFWLPGPIDHLFDVRASIYETADKVRVLSLLDWIFVLALLLPVQVRSKLKKFDLLILGFLLLLSTLSFFGIFYHAVVLETERVPALFTGLTFVRLLAVFLVVNKFVYRPEHIYGVYMGFFAGTLGLLANTVITYFRGPSLSGRLVAGTFGNNIFAVLLSVMIIFAGAYKEATQKPLFKHLLSGLQLVCLVLMILSGTRMALALLILGWGFLFFLRHKNPLRLLSQATIFVIVFLLAVSFLLRLSSTLNIGTDRVASLIRIATGDASQAEIDYTFRTWIVRNIIWQFAWERLAPNPWFGIGPGQWNYERTLSTQSYIVSPNGIYDSVSDPHNGYIHLGVEYGVPTLIFYVLFLALCLWKGWRSLKRIRHLTLQQNEPRLKKLFVLFGGLFAAMLILLLGEITNAYITKIHLQLFMGVILFSLLQADKISANMHPPFEPVPHAQMDRDPHPQLKA
jgi:O-antigen ligase